MSSNLMKKRSNEEETSCDSQALKIPRLSQEPDEESSSSSSSSDSSSCVSLNNESQCSTSELAHILEDSKSEFVFPPSSSGGVGGGPSSPSSKDDLSDDIFGELMHYDASVAEAITNNHFESNRELIDVQMGLLEGDPSPPPPMEPPPPPPPPPFEEEEPNKKESSPSNGSCPHALLQEEADATALPIITNGSGLKRPFSALGKSLVCQSIKSSLQSTNDLQQGSDERPPLKRTPSEGGDLAHEAISDDDFDDEELDALVNGDLSVSKPEEVEEPTIAHEERIKIVLDDRSKKNFFEVLPDGWIQVSHSSGMPIYLHRPSRVVSLSKPYFLGKGSVKHHAIPVSSIPCLSYKRGLEEEAETKKRLEAEMNDPEKAKNGCPIFPKARVQSIEEFAVSESLNAEQFRDFCKGRFIFKELRIKKFNNWTDRRKFQKQVVKKSLKAAIDKTKEGLTDSPSKEVQLPGKDEGQSEGPISSQSNPPANKERPTLPEGTKVLSVPMIELEPLDGNSENASALNQKVVKKSRKEWIINPVGKSMVCILHEYIQQCLKTQPTYRFEEMESSATPYSATVIINGMEYGRGFGTSKKIAKSEAARITIGILIPEIKNSIPSKSQEGEVDAPDLSFFDDIRIEDPRVNELCSRTSEPSPYTILLNCLQRNYGLGDLNITTELRPLRNKKNEFTMRVDKREVKVVCKNKRDGKQLASQKLLQLLHPHVKSWGSLLSLYGNRAARIQKVKKAKESEVTELQSRSSTDTAPSIAILEKLRKEMLNLRAARNAMAPIGKFVMPLSSSSGGTPGGIERINL